MKIGITDSGVGGLSVCAAVEARLKHSPVREDVELLYLTLFRAEVTVTGDDGRSVRLATIRLGR